MRKRYIDNLRWIDVLLQVLPEYWLSYSTITINADDNSCNLRWYNYYDHLDEDNKIMYYRDYNDVLHEFHYEN